MTDSPGRPRSDITVIIPHPAEPHILMLNEGGAWQLPRLLVENIWSAGVGVISQHVQDALGLAASVLREAMLHRDQNGRVSMTYVLEPRDPLWQPPSNARWGGRADVGELALPEQRAVVDDYLAEAEGRALPLLRTQWYRAGWLDTAIAWITEQLMALGRPLTGPVVQVKHWSISCVLRAPTLAGDVYFKAAAPLPLFVNEPVVTAWLARRYPAHIVAPLAIDAERRWMLLPDFGQVIGRNGPLADRLTMLSLLGDIQRDSASVLDDLLAVPCHDRRLDRLADHVEALAADSEALAGLNDAERDLFRALQPRLRHMCGELAACGVPQTLVHGDLHLGNVSVLAGRHQFFDWTDACITHPFLDLISVFDEKDPAVQVQLRDAYLAPWAEYTPMPRLLEAWSLAGPLSDLHQAVSYRQILAGLEPAAHHHFVDAVPEYIRNVLRVLGAERGG
jgi:hypothetical protein